jgi:hypothetical protein
MTADVGLVVIKNVIGIITVKIVVEKQEITITKNALRSARKKNSTARKTAKSRDIIVN